MEWWCSHLERVVNSSIEKKPVKIECKKGNIPFIDSEGENKNQPQTDRTGGFSLTIFSCYLHGVIFFRWTENLNVCWYAIPNRCRKKLFWCWMIFHKQHVQHSLRALLFFFFLHWCMLVNCEHTLVWNLMGLLVCRKRFISNQKIKIHTKKGFDLFSWVCNTWSVSLCLKLIARTHHIFNLNSAKSFSIVFIPSLITSRFLLLFC